MEEEKQNTDHNIWWDSYPRSGDDPADGNSEAAAAAAAAASGALALATPPSNNATAPTANGNVAGAPSPPDLPAADSQAELYFLIANFLSQSSACSQAAEVLKKELVRVFMTAGRDRRLKNSSVLLRLSLFCVFLLFRFFSRMSQRVEKMCHEMRESVSVCVWLWEVFEVVYMPLANVGCVQLM